MNALHWNETFSVNIESIDRQHIGLFDFVNKFYQCIGKKDNNELIGDLLADLKKYAFTHFSYEESLMKKYNFPEYEQHYAEHKAFAEKVDSVQKRLNEGKVVVSFELTSFIKEWLVSHIQGTDKRYSDFLIKCGVV